MADTPGATTPRGGRAFWLLWGFDALVAAVVVFFFFWGLVDGSVSSFNIVLWLGILAIVGAVVGGSLALRKAGQFAAAISLLLVLAVPGLGFTLLLAAVLVLQPRWN
jgi:hypothetical protein